MQPKDLSMFTKFPAMHQSVFVGCLTVNTVLYTLRIECSQCVQNPDAFSVLMANSRQVYLPPKLDLKENNYKVINAWRMI